MSLPADLLAPDPARLSAPAHASFLGARWACGLAGTLLVLFALTLLSHVLSADDPSRVEKIVQQPVTPEAAAAAASKPSAVSADDPGDNLP